MTGYSSTYGARFVAQMEEPSHRDLMEAMARSLEAELHPKMVLDVGCGPGHMLPVFENRNVIARGTEHPESPFFPNDKVFPVDLEKDMLSFVPDRSYDLVSCIEVGEHLTPNAGSLLVKALCRISKRWVFFSAAYPGQGGTGHINERPMGYWARQFHDFGFELDEPATIRIRDAVEPFIHAEWWYRRVRLYRKAEP